MRLKVKEFQSVCKSILEAVDTTTNSVVNETLELKLSNNTLFLNVTNKEYYVSSKQGVEEDGEFVVTVNAKLFLSLIAKITTEFVDIEVKDNNLVIKANGNYKLPMIYENDKLLEIKPIVINNPTTSLVMNSNNLLDIISYNTKEIANGVVTRPVQSMYYLDEQGCITFTKFGACVNAFSLTQPLKVLLTQKLVKLFKLFPRDTDVQVTFGYDELSGIVQPKISFNNDKITITSLLNGDDSMLVSVPSKAIRDRVSNNYRFSINVDKSSLISAIERLMLFKQPTEDSSTVCAKFDFMQTSVKMTASDNENTDVVEYVNTTIDEPYSAYLNLSVLKNVVENCQEQYLTINFGDTKAFVIARGNIKNVIPEVRLV